MSSLSRASICPVYRISWASLFVLRSNILWHLLRSQKSTIEFCVRPTITLQKGSFPKVPLPVSLSGSVIIATCVRTPHFTFQS